MYIEPFANDLETGIQKALDALNSLLPIWRPPARTSLFRTDMWWQHVACPYCKRRVEYETERWKTGEHVWNRGMCMRHWLIYHLSMITPNEPAGLIANQPISITADNRTILFKIKTNNYDYNIRLTKQMAEAEVLYKGTAYRFTYRNHLNGMPYISSYLNIVFDIYALLEVFRDFLRDYIAKRRLYCNVVINDAIVLPPAQDDCPTCQL
jgi:hypothetical protein